MDPYDRAAMDRFIRDHPVAFDLMALLFWVVLPIVGVIAVVVEVW